jgi:hypothetical protein
MENRQDYLARLQVAIQKSYKCGATHDDFQPVVEYSKHKLAWKGIVEIFDLHGHPKAKRCYAWPHLDKPYESEEGFVTVLEIPPVNSPQTAVHVSILNDGRKK